MRVKDVMVTSVIVCRTTQNLAEVVETMWEQRCGALPVLDSHGRVMSMITDRDICIALGTRNVKASDLLVEDVSLPTVFTCAPYDDVHLALTTMVCQNVRRLPVVDRAGELSGIVSIDDLVRRSEKRPAKGGISHEEIATAMKMILVNRVPRARARSRLVAALA